MIQASTNFVNWANVATNISAEGLVFYADLDAHFYPYRFYRLVSLNGEPETFPMLGFSGLNLKLSGLNGESYVLQASVDLHSWVDVHTNSGAGESITLTNYVEAEIPYKFFRLRSR